MIDLKVTQGRKRFLDLAIDAAKIDQGLKDEIRAVAREARRDMAAAIRTPKSGRSYFKPTVLTAAQLKRRKRLGGRRTHKASAPGEAPASFTGNLLRAITAKAARRSKGFTQVVFANRRMAAHRHLLEFGTGPRYLDSGKSVGRVAPRPFIGPLIAKYEPIFPARIEARLDKVVDEINR